MSHRTLIIFGALTVIVFSLFLWHGLSSAAFVRLGLPLIAFEAMAVGFGLSASFVASRRRMAFPMKASRG